METLATFFVGVVAFANSMAPQANLPKVLGVRVMGDDTLVSTNSSDTNDDELDFRSRDQIKNRLTQVRENKNNFLEEARERRKEKLEAAKKAREEALENAKERREEFKKHLEELKDERKQKIVEHLDERLASLNQKWVNHFNRILTRLTEILAKIQGRTDELAGNGADVTEVNTAISAANSAIDTAQAAVDGQAGKTYVIEITDEESLGENVSEVIHQFREDIAGVREVVRDAREAVRSAYKALKEASGELTPTLTPTP